MNSARSSSLQKQAFRSLNQDGLLEIGAGITFFICSAFVGNASLIFLLFIPVFILAPGLSWLQLRVIHPRIGYAKLAEDGQAQQGRGILIFAFVIFAIYALALVSFGVSSDVSYWRRWAPALAGALCCGGFLLLARRSGLVRHYFYIGASLLGGLAFSRVGFQRPYENVQMFLLAMAFLMVVSGSLFLMRFLKTHPLPEEKDVSEHA